MYEGRLTDARTRSVVGRPSYNAMSMLTGTTGPIVVFRPFNVGKVVVLVDPPAGGRRGAGAIGTKGAGEASGSGRRDGDGDLYLSAAVHARQSGGVGASTFTLSTGQRLHFAYLRRYRMTPFGQSAFRACAKGCRKDPASRLTV